MKFWLLAIAILLCSLPELWFGAYGLVLPLTLVPVFFAAVSYGWFTGALCALGTGIWLDLIFGRSFPISIPAFLMQVLVIWGMLRDRGVPELPDVILPAIASTAAAELVWLLGEFCNQPLSLSNLGIACCLFIWQSTIGSVLVFFGFYFLGECSERLGIAKITHFSALRAGMPRRSNRWSPDGNLR